MLIECLTVGPLQACCYLLASDAGEAAVVDPGGDAEVILEQIRYRKLTPRLLLATHGHIDHIQAIPELKKAFPDAQLAIHEADEAMLGDPAASLAALIGLPVEPCAPDRLIADGDTLGLGPHSLEVVHTPGHSPGSVSFLVRRDAEPHALFSGDALFAGGIGRTDFPGGDYQQLLDSIRQRLFVLPGDTVVYPGHGEPTTIDCERRTNPFLRA